MKNGYCITHEYSGNVTTKSIHSRHRTLEAAEKQLAKRRRSFAVANPSTFPTRAIFPLAIRELRNGEPGDRV